jgi:hypothetical protein
MPVHPQVRKEPLLGREGEGDLRGGAFYFAGLLLADEACSCLVCGAITLETKALDV